MRNSRKISNFASRFYPKINDRERDGRAFGRANCLNVTILINLLNFKKCIL